MFEPEIKRGIILDHYKCPRNHGLLENKDGYIEKRKSSETCIDDITIQMKVEDNIIKDIRFDGEACTISTSSTSIICDMIINLDINDAKGIINEYHKMLEGKEFNENMLDEANAFNELYKQANRIKCGLIGIELLEELLENK